MRSFSVILLSFVAAVVGAGGTGYVISRLNPVTDQPKQASVPKLAGLPEADARSNLEASGLVMLVGGREPSAEAEAGTVIGQSPEPGTRVPEGEPVTVTFASAMPKVPDVAGRSSAQATLLLQQAGYAVETGEAVPSEKLAKGLVALQSPAANSSLAKNQSVRIQLSAGPAAIEVPKLTGLSPERAKLRAEEAGFKIGRLTWVDLAETRSNMVIRQKPAAGEQAKPGASVNLVANRGD